MGKRWNRKRKKEERKRKSNNNDPNKRGAPWAAVVPGNAKFEAYYALQGLHNTRYNEEKKEFEACTSEAEKEEERMKWLTSLRTMLPASFRIGTDVDATLRERLELELDSHFCKEELEITLEDNLDEKQSGDGTKTPVTKRIAPIRSITYIPHAYQLSVDRKTIRRTPALKEFHTWLTTQTSCGNITRQETVSMIPPIVLGVQPHDKVLDMCAAPGSKTSQLLEIVSTFDSDDTLEPRGCVVANDSDSKRAYMLVHQLRRINSPAVLVTACDAQFFPLLGGEGGTFDRVLCDVPCSGDGTARKNPGVWRNWSCLGSLSLHALQLSIAFNGARLTKVGGHLCYSTCAMSPIENEAVVAELLRVADGALELVEKRMDMPGLVARPGWSTWKVMRESQSRKEIKNQKKKNNAKMQAKRKEWNEKMKREEKSGDGGVTVDGVEVKEVAATNGEAALANGVGGDDKAKTNGKTGNDDDVTDDFQSGGAPPSWDEETLLARAAAEGLTEFKSFDEVPEEWRRSVRKTVFPPTPEEAAKFGLEKCLRCLPQDMDTGGFFVALLKKVAPLSAKAKREAAELAESLKAEEAANGAGPPAAKRAKTDDAAVEEEVATDVADDTTDANADTEMEMDSQLGDTTDVGDAETAVAEEDKKPAATDKKPAGKSFLRAGGKTRSDLGNEGFVPVDKDTWAPLKEFYGFSDTFPTEQFMARASGEAKSLSFLGAPIKDLIDRGIQERVKIVNSGLKAFAKNNKDCKVKYRVAQEGIQYVAPHMTKRKVVANLDDFSKCLDTNNIRVEIFSDEFAEEVRKLEPGSFVVALKGYENDASKKLFLVMWRCRKDAIDSLVAKVEQDGMKSKLRAIPGYTDKDEEAEAERPVELATS